MLTTKRSYARRDFKGNEMAVSGQKQSVSQSFATPMQFDWDGESQTGWLLGMTFKEYEVQKALR